MASVISTDVGPLAATKDNSSDPRVSGTGTDIPAAAEGAIAAKNGPDVKLERLILKRAQRIEAATSELFQLDNRARSICEDIKQKLDFDFVSVQLVDRGEQIIQTVYGSALSEWYKISRHSLEGDPKFLDIQAHVAASKPPVIQIITGWDERFDAFIYRKFGHQHFSRSFIPLIVVHDSEGRLTEAHPEQFGFEVDAPEPGQILLPPRFEDPTLPYPLYEVIGTIEAGFDNSTRRETPRIVTQQDARTLFRLACLHAYLLGRTTLSHVLEVIARSAKEIAGADCCSLHFPLVSHRNRHIYDVWAGPPMSRTLPRVGGLGEQAIKAKKPMFVGEASCLREFNPGAYEAGTRTMAAFPLIIDEGRQPNLLQSNLNEARTGVLYVGYREDHVFSEDELDGLQLFASLAKDAIRHASHYVETSHSARQLANLHDVSRALAAEADHENLLPSIAGNAANVLAADLVIVYEYDPEQQRFLRKPAVEGRRQTALGLPSSLDRGYTPPVRLIEASSPTFARCSSELAELYGTGESLEQCRQFLEIEKIKAGVAVPLGLGNEVVGIILVNYRRPRIFSRYEENIIGTLASIAAVAIQNRRLLRARQENVHAMTHQLRSPLSAMKTSVTGITDRVEQKDLANELSQVADQLEMLDALCEGVFTSLSSESSGLVAFETDDLEETKMLEEVRRIWNFLQFTSGRCDMILRIASDTDPARTVRMSRRFFTNVIYSLLHNATKYADRNSELRVRCMDVPGFVRLEIRSIGEPIPPDEREEIFHKFVQGRRAHRRQSLGRGVGLGLWVARKLMNIAQGDIRLEPEPHNPSASTFAIDIPN